MEKTQLAVLFGGRACEHDVSVITALQCMAAADAERYHVIPVYIDGDGAWYTGEKLRDIGFMKCFDPQDPGVVRVYPDVTAGSRALLTVEHARSLFRSADELKVYCRIDVALLAFHGMHGEDGCVQGLLELMDVPYTSAGVLGSAVGMDKIAMRMLFKGCGFPVLDMEWFTREDWENGPEEILDRLEARIPYPMYVKPANLGSSIGISKAKDRDSLRGAIEVALAYDRRVLAERGVNEPREINCSALGFDRDVRTSVCEMPVAWDEFLTFDEKYMRGGKSGGAKGGPGAKAGGMETLRRRIPAPVSDGITRQVQELSAAIFRALDCRGVVRIDFLLEGEKVFVNEINTIPGSLAFYLWEASGMPYAQLIDRLAEYALRAAEEKKRNAFAFESDLLKSSALGTKRQGLK